MVPTTTMAPSLEEQVSLIRVFHLMDTYIQVGVTADIPVVGFQAFADLKPSPSLERKTIYKLLLNSLSAEYALNLTPVVNDDKYWQSSLDWTFPQAYYSVLFSARAFMSIQGFDTANENTIRKNIGGYVGRNYYPFTMSFYAYGTPGNLHAHKLSKQVPEIGLFLKETRANQLRAAIDPQREAADSAYVKTLSKMMGNTTYFDLLSRLRISTANREVAQLCLTISDVKAFHACLGRIVNQINLVHELYVAKALGIWSYQELIEELPQYLRESCAGQRLTNIIIPTMASF